MSRSPENNEHLALEVYDLLRTFVQALTYLGSETRVRFGIVVFILSMTCLAFISYSEKTGEVAFTSTMNLYEQGRITVTDIETGTPLTFDVFHGMELNSRLFLHNDPRYPGYFYDNAFLYEPSRNNTELPQNETVIEIVFLSFDELSNITKDTSFHYASFVIPRQELLERTGLLSPTNAFYGIITRDLTTSFWNLRLFSTTSPSEDKILSLGTLNRAILQAISPNGEYSVVMMDDTLYLLNSSTQEKTEIPRGNLVLAVSDTGSVLTLDSMPTTTTNEYFYSTDLRYRGSTQVDNREENGHFYSELTVLDAETNVTTTFAYTTRTSTSVVSITPAGFPIIKPTANPGETTLTLITLGPENIRSSP